MEVSADYVNGFISRELVQIFKHTSWLQVSDCDIVQFISMCCNHSRHASLLLEFKPDREETLSSDHFSSK